MAVIRCPHCNKPNPDFIEVCQYCDLPLKAAIDAPPPGVPPAETTDKPGITRCPNCGKPNPSFVEACQYCDTPLQPGAVRAAPAAADDTPDWLKGMAAAAPADDVPDWLKPAPAAAPAADDSLDWLTGASAAAPAADVPDWLKPVSAAPQAASAGVTDWLTQPAAAPADDVPDWLKSLSGDNTPAASDTPDWSKPAPATPAPVASATPTPTPAPADDMPDWLKGMAAAAPAAQEPASWEPPVASVTPAPTPADDMPDWLKGMAAAAPAAQEPASWEPPVASTPIEDIPDWLKDTPAAAPADTQAGWEPPVAPVASVASATPTPAPSEDLPDWLGGMAAAPLDTAPAAPSNDLPDWLKNTGPLPDLPPSEPGKPATAPLPELTEDAPDWLKAMRSEASAETPDWQSGASASAPDWASPAWGEPASPAAPAETPDWLTNLGTAPTPSSGDQPGASPFTTTDYDAGDMDDMAGAEVPTGTPDWLAALRPTAAPSASAEESPADDLLTQAALPAWLSAMRPVSAGEAAIAPEQDDYEEKVGVLAGLRGVLQAEPMVVLPRKAAEQVHKLTFSQDQLRQAKLFSQQWAADTAEITPPAAKKALRFPIARWVITLLMLVAVLGPMYALPGLFQRPTSLSLSVERAHQSVETAPLDRPALVVFDYEPLHSGELSVAAEAVLAHLFKRGVPVVAVSTLPTGAAQAERTLYDAATQPQDFPIAKLPETDYINLGYIPGGQVGVLQFATQPRLAFANSFSGTANIWQNAVLTDVRTLDDFGLLVLVASDPALVRAWVEQTRALVGDTPVIAAVSASAEPLVRPYYESRQLAGLVGGIIEAGQYEQRTARPYGRALQSWDGLGGGLYMAALIILAGGVFYGVRTLIRPTKKR